MSSVLLVDKLQDDVLQRISEEDMPQLLKALETDFPHSLSIHTFITVRSEWQKKDPQQELYVFCPRGSPPSKGTVICITMSDFQMIVLYTLEDDCKLLESSLKETRAINWDCEFRFPFVHEKHLNVVKEIIHAKELKNVHFVPNKSYEISTQEALKMETECPPGMYLAPLELQHATIINDAWPHHDKDSLKYVEKHIKFCYTIGMFTVKDSELVCWLIRADYGLGLLTTVKEHRRKGYSTILVKHMARKLAEKGLNIGLHVNIQNKASNSLFQSLGCKALYETTWVIVSQ